MSKYNRTFHLPFSKGATNDDKIASSVIQLLNVPIVISEKIDGSNCSLEYENCYARTHAHPPTHPSFDVIKALHSQIKHKIPENYQIFGENTFALHSIAYSELPGYFLMFNVRDLNTMTWLAWEEIELWAQELEVPTVPVLFKGSVSSENELQELVEQFMKLPSECGGEREGVVVRVARQFIDEEFSQCVMKNVRKNHVSPNNEHWMHQEIIKNKLKLNK